MPDQEFENVEAIKKFYGKQIKDAEDADKPALQLAQAEAIAEFADKRAAAAERKGWLRDALEEFPAAKDFPELVTGDTEEAIKASAKATAERVSKLTANVQTPADKLYGLDEPIRPGGGTPPAPRQSDDEKFIADFQQRWNNNGANSGEGVTKVEIDRYVKMLAGANIAAHLAENSRIPAVRAALASVKPK
jgi:hypothetical protein